MIEVINLSEYQAPKGVEHNNKDWVTYGDNDEYYNFLRERYEKSPTNCSVINNISRLVFGRGLHCFDASKKPLQYAKMKMLVSDEDLKRVILDFKALGNGHFQIHYNKDRTVQKIYHIPTNLIRPEKCNEDGDIVGYYYSDNWEDVRKFPPKRFPAFGTSKEAIEIYCIKNYAIGLKYFGQVDYKGALPYAMLEEEIADYLINDVQNGFSGTKVINFNNGEPDPQKQKLIVQKVESKLTGARGLKTIVSFNKSEADKTTVDDIPLNDAPQHYQYLSKECVEKILNGHTVVSPMLVGVVTDNHGFSSNADEIEVASKYFYNIAIKPIQDTIISALNEIFLQNDIILDLFFKRLNLLENIDEKEQIEEEQAETQLSAVNTLETILKQVDENQLGAEWVKVDERDVNYDDEDNLNTHLSELENEFNKETVLSKVLRFFGNPKGDLRSDQDREVKQKFFKVRYQYTGNANPERGFCKVMMSKKDRLFRKEDIDLMSTQKVNAGLGEFGADTYDIFRFKGGARCHHSWKRVTFMLDLKSTQDGYKKIGTRNAEIKGYKVTNPYEVSVQPNNLPLKGFSPRNKNLPNDVK